MNAYEMKQERRRERMIERAEKLRAKATAEYRKADLREEVSGIPFGQPILVGHHSEGRHRRAIERADNAMRRGVEASKKAAELEARAATPSTAISSDDPDAIDKLQAKIIKAEALQRDMRNANKLVRKGDREGLAAMGFSPAVIDQLFKPDFAGRLGFADYQLTNNNANIRRMKQRVAQLERAAEAETVEREQDGVKIVENAEENRLQLFFDGKPSAEIRAVLKSNGFRWARSVGAWQRHLNNGARYAADCVLRKVAEADA